MINCILLFLLLLISMGLLKYTNSPLVIHFLNLVWLFHLQELLIITLLVSFKACVHYFSLFLKDRCISLLFRTKYIEKKFNLHLLSLPTVLWALIPFKATRLLETSCLDKITVCVIETMVMTLPLVQMKKARREVNRTNKCKPR